MLHKQQDEGDRLWHRYRCNGNALRIGTVLPLVILGMVLIVTAVSCTERPVMTLPAPITLTPRVPSSTISPTPTLPPVSRGSPIPPLQPTIEELGTFMIQLRSRQFIPEADVKSGLDWLQTVPDPRVHVLLQLYGPPDSTIRARLEKSGIRLLNYIPSNAWFASIPRTLAIDDPVIPIIRWFGPILPEDKVPAELVEGAIGSWALRERNRVALEVSFFEDVDLRDVEQIIHRHGGIITGAIPAFNKMTVEVPKDAILTLAAEDSVRWIDQVPPPPTKHPGGG